MGQRVGVRLCVDVTHQWMGWRWWWWLVVGVLVGVRWWRRRWWWRVVGMRCDMKALDGHVVMSVVVLCHLELLVDVGSGGRRRRQGKGGDVANDGALPRL